MAQLNRLLLGILGLAALLVGGLLLVLPSAVMTALEQGLWALRAGATPLHGSLGILLIAAGLILLLLELWPHAPRVLQSASEGARVQYPVDAVERLTEAHLRRLEGVESAQVRLRGGAKRLSVRAWLQTREDPAPQTAVQTAVTALRSYLEQGFGLPVAQVELTLQPRASHERRGASTRAGADSAAPAAAAQPSSTR